MSKENVIEFLMGINMEDPLYYFTSYASPELAHKRAVDAGVPIDLADSLKSAAHYFKEAYEELGYALDDIRNEFDIEEEEVEC